MLIAAACAAFLFLLGWVNGEPGIGFVAALFPVMAYVIFAPLTSPQPGPRVEQARRPSRWGIGLGIPLGPFVLSVWRRLGRW